MNFRPNFKSIVTRLTLFGLAILAVGALGRIYFLSDFLRNDITELTTSQLLTLSNYVARNVEHNLIERRELLERVAQKFPPELLRNPRRMQDWLQDRHEVNPLFTFGMTVIDLSGKALADYPALPNRVGSSYADRDYFQQAAQGQFFIGKAVIGRIAKVPVLPMAVPLYDRTGKVCAVLMGITALDDDNFLDSLQKTHVGIASVPLSGWFVVARLPTSEAFSALSRLRHFVIRNTFIMSGLFLLIILVGLRALLKPLRNAAEHADRMTREEIPLEPLPVERDDEVGHLTAAFNRVLAKLLESRAKLEHMAHHDTLTGLPNRQLLADRMKQALARAKRSGGKVAVLFLDLDGFKPINDELGHEAGDAALREVALRLSKVVRDEDTLARVGGDEFVIFLSDLNEQARTSAELVANKCLAVFNQPLMMGEQFCTLGTSIGIALGNSGSATGPLLIAADRAMYQAKAAGRSQFYWAKEDDSCDLDKAVSAGQPPSKFDI